MRLTLGSAEVRFTERADGDFGADAGELGRDERMRAVAGDRPWQVARQVHGTRAVVVDRATGEIGEADALVTTDPGLALAVRTADCAPVVLAAPRVVGVVHAGWRGLAGGIVEGAVGVMRSLGAADIEAALGPCIHAECYEFSKDDLDELAARYGDGVRGTTPNGAPALDLPAAVRTALSGLDVPLRADADACTACDATRWFSHRARGEVGRQATVAWLA